MGTAQQINAYHRTLPFIEIMDSTLRDGEQTSTVSFLPHEKLVMARKLLKAVNVDRIEVASARVSDGEKEAVSRHHDLQGCTADGTVGQRRGARIRGWRQVC